MIAVNKGKLFKNISVIGLLVDYHQKAVVHIYKELLNFIDRTSSLLECGGALPIEHVISSIVGDM